MRWFVYQPPHATFVYCLRNNVISHHEKINRYYLVQDGEWEAPSIENPAYKGEWKPKQIDNPAYKGEWVHPKIANPEYILDEAVYDYDSFGAIGIDIWQVKSGSIFDDILITDDLSEAVARQTTFTTLATGEKVCFSFPSFFLKKIKRMLAQIKFLYYSKFLF